MSHTMADFIIDRMQAWGVGRIFGYPGDGINGLLGALGRASDEIELVQARHEEMTAFMACGHAKFTGETGVCLATSGPGAIHLLNGLYDAKLDRQPVVAIVGHTARAALGGAHQQEVDLPALFKDVAHGYCPQQPRSEHGDVGAARVQRRSEVRGVAVAARLPVRGVRAVDRAGRRAGREAGRDRAPRGTRRSRHRGRS